jgi:hypothetical protein
VRSAASDSQPLSQLSLLPSWLSRIQSNNIGNSPAPAVAVLRLMDT